MPTQNLNVSVTAAQVQAVKDAFTAVLNALPFLINLTTEERKSIFKAGGDSLSFIQNALVAAQNNPNILPPSFNTTAFKTDVELFIVLTEFNTIAASMASRIDDTRMAVGGEAMRSANQVYEYVKTAVKTTPGLKPVAEQLGERFKQASKKKQSPKPTT